MGGAPDVAVSSLNNIVPPLNELTWGNFLVDDFFVYGGALSKKELEYLKKNNQKPTNTKKTDGTNHDNQKANITNDAATMINTDTNANRTHNNMNDNSSGDNNNDDDNYQYINIIITIMIIIWNIITILLIRIQIIIRIIITIIMYVITVIQVLATVKE